MIKPGLAFVSTIKPTNFWTLVQVLLCGHVVHISSCSLVLVSRHERIAIVGDFYTGNAMQ
jgi:non-ribosomal peptide synthetase component F